MDWTSLLYAVVLVYFAYEAGRWSMRQQIKDETEIAFLMMKAFDKAVQKEHYKNWEEYDQDAEEQWEEIIENDKKQKQRSFNFDKRDH